MKILIFSFLFITLLSCNSGYKKADDAQDAGRQFIRAELDGDIDKATFYLLKDTTNLSIITKWKQGYDALSSDEKHAYRNAEIRPVKIEMQPDSTWEYVFTNSYQQKDTTVIDVVNTKEGWLVDLKYLHKWTP